ncbi:MAG: PilW family protein [bacterium]
MRGTRGERGLALIEVAVVMILGTIVMGGLVGFYLSSQGLWLDASTQAIAQREASLVASAVRDSVRKSSRAIVTSSPDSLHQQVALYRGSESAPYWYFFWNPSDSLVCAGPDVTDAAAGPMGFSPVERFQLQASSYAVRLDLRLRSASGERIETSAFAVMRNSAEYARLANR